jgi:hypothetical protein
MRGLQHGLERLGWDLVAADINVPAGTARIELRRGALAVTFDARNGHASTTREIIEVVHVPTGRRGDRFIADRLHTRFIGRTAHEGPRAGLRFLAHYIADNASRPALPRDVRGLLAAVMDGYHTTGGSNGK